MRRVNQNAGPLWGAWLCSESGCVYVLCVRVCVCADGGGGGGDWGALVGSHVLAASS